jgi:hypothetical protein
VFWDLPLMIDTVARPAAGIDAIHQGCNLLLMVAVRSGPDTGDRSLTSFLRYRPGCGRSRP